MDLRFLDFGFAIAALAACEINSRKSEIRNPKSEIEKWLIKKA